MSTREFYLVGAGAALLGLAAGYLLWGRERPVEGVTVELREDRAYRIQRVVDGDTAVLASGLHLRYAGIDAPENGTFTGKPEPYAAEATARNRELVENKTVHLRFEREHVDRYGRILAHVYVVDGENDGERSVEETLVTEGLARALAIGENTALYPRLKALELAARKARRGIWSGRRPAPAAAKFQDNPSSTWPFVASRGSEVIHRASCPHARKITTANRIAYPTLDDARASGRTFCKTCRPQEVRE